MKRSETAKLVAMLMAAYDKPKDVETSSVYERMLEDLDFTTAHKAIARLISTSRFFPTVAEIREQAFAIEHGDRRSGAESWQDVTAAIRSVGYIGTPRFKDPIVANIIGRWGWYKMCVEGDEISDRARFIEMYNAMARREHENLVSGIPVLPRTELPRIASGPMNDMELREKARTEKLGLLEWERNQGAK